MPFVKISALPSKSHHVDKIMEAMEYDLYQKEILPTGSATILWQKLDCITHTPACTGKQESVIEFDSTKNEFPIFVDLYLTTVFNYEVIAKIMKSITATLSSKTKIDPKYVFIHTHMGNPVHVYVYVFDKVWPCEIEHAGT